MATMDLATGPGLVAAIASFLDKDDLTDKIPGFVRLAESAFSRELRLREQVKRADATVSGSYFALPSDFAEAKRVAVLSGPSPSTLTYASEDELFGLRSTAQPRNPSRFTITGTALEFAPVPADTVTVELTYWAKPPVLDLATPGATSWLLLKAPDLYLYGSLLSSAPFLAEDERLPTWTALFTAILKSLNDEARRAETSGGPLNARRRQGF